MKVRVIRQGHTLYIAIPKQAAEEYGIEEGMVAELYSVSGKGNKVVLIYEIDKTIKLK
jgi:hypothetical protein